MRVFVTEATGFIGSAVVQDLLAHGHEVVGLARSDKSAAALERVGVGVVRGTTEDLDVLKNAAADTGGVIHTAYIHDFSPTADPMRFAEIDRDAIAAFGEALAGTGKPLVVAAALPGLAPGVTATEDDKAPENPPYPRFTEQAAIALVGKGVRVSAVRMPPSVHGEGDPNFVLMLTRLARAKGFSAYVGEGANAWSAVHRLGAARLFRLALEQAPAGTLLNAVGDEAVPFKDVAAAIGRSLNLPVKSVSAEEAAGHFGMPLAIFAQLDVPASSKRTRSSSAGSRSSPASSRTSTRGTTRTPPALTSQLDKLATDVTGGKKMTKIAARRTLLTGAALAVAAVLIVGCTSQDSSSSASAQGTSAASAAQSPPTSPVAGATTPADSAPAKSGGSSSAPTASTPSSGGSSSDESVPGVIDCGKSLSQLDVRPTSLLLVCSDGTAGLQNLTWSHWGHNITTGSPGQAVPSATATGTGEFFLNDCNPNCAQGHDQTYPVQVTLSVVYSSPYGGTYFGQASLIWQGNRPPAGTKSTYILPDPSGL